MFSSFPLGGVKEERLLTSRIIRSGEANQLALDYAYTPSPFLVTVTKCRLSLTLRPLPLKAFARESL